MPATPSWKEDHISQVPTLQLLQNLGWTYLAPAEALEMRTGRAANVILHGVLEQQLRAMNVIRYRGSSGDTALRVPVESRSGALG
jgi:type I restriction enzyme R subunit